MTNNWVNKFYKNFESAFKDKNITRFESGDGYSLIGQYGSNFKKQMGVSQDGNQVPFFKFYFDKNDPIENGKFIPLIISVGVTAEVKEGEDIRYMINDNRVKRLRPIELTSLNEFYISTKDGMVFEKKKEKFINVNLKSVYQRIYNVHVSDLLSVMGLYRRLKIFILRRIPAKTLQSLSILFDLSHWIIKGERFTYNVITERFLDKKYDKREISPPKEPADNIDFFGYRVSIWTLYSYSILAILFNVLVEKNLTKLLPMNDPFLGLLVIAIAIVSIVTYDKVAPFGLRIAIKHLEIKVYDLKYKGIKLKI